MPSPPTAGHVAYRSFPVGASLSVLFGVMYRGMPSLVSMFEFTPLRLPLHGQFHRRDGECHAPHASRVHRSGAWYVLLVPVRTLVRRERRIVPPRTMLRSHPSCPARYPHVATRTGHLAWHGSYLQEPIFSEMEI